MRVEGNLTTLVHGEGSSALSLHPDELGDAADAVLTTVSSLLGAVPPAGAWDLHRLDPSVTLAGGGRTPDLIASADRAWQAGRTPRQTVTRYNQSTVTLMHSKWRAWSVYDKGEEMRKRGWLPPVDGMLRCEARIRPRKGTGNWKALAPTLALGPEVLTMAQHEIDSLTDSVIAQAAAAGGLGMVQMLVAGGATPNKAMQLAMYAQIAGEYGQGTFDRLHLPDSTTRRWRAELQRYLGPAETREARMLAAFTDGPLAGREELAPLFARDIQVKRVGRPATRRQRTGEEGSEARSGETKSEHRAPAPASSAADDVAKTPQA